jgi:hypothetical protein
MLNFGGSNITQELCQTRHNIILKTEFSLELHMQEFLALPRVVSPRVDTHFQTGFGQWLGLVCLVLAHLCHVFGNECGTWYCPILIATCHYHGLC